MAVTGFTIREGEKAPLMRELTTLRLGGRVLAEVRLHEAGAASALSEIASRLGGRLACLGAGSNILAGDGELPIVLVRNAMEPEIAVLTDDGGKVVVRAAASVKLPVLLGRLAAMNLAGLEGLAGIPGTVGGAVAMNAGSYGQDVADALVALSVVTEDGVARSLRRDEIDFGYRRMAFPGRGGWFSVLSAQFALVRKEPGLVAALGKEHMARKKATQPVTEASAGCVFKNPAEGMGAGRLLDEAGFRGKRLGGMAFSSMHANFLINEGSGTSAAALDLMAMAREAVNAAFGIALETEVAVWL